MHLNKIVGALCIYLLIGAIWAVFYHLLEDFFPGSISGLEGHEGPALPWRLIYFSFVTATTLGYGDVLPLTLYAEALVILETVLAQFYLAVLIASLVGAYGSDRDQSSRDSSVSGDRVKPRNGGWPLHSVNRPD